jgi:hypothetical protein
VEASEGKALFRSGNAARKETIFMQFRSASARTNRYRRRSDVAVNEPGRQGEEGRSRKRSKLKTKVDDEAHWTKRRKATGQFLDQKKNAAPKPYKGVRREKAPS